jgi:3-hydroxyacyl-[acyl-carrier-protein] dehydratase
LAIVTSTQGQPADVVFAPFGRDVIESIIPHRDPFLFVDEVLELEPGARVVARKIFHDSEWFFEGHFPGRPIVPGVIMVEAAAQTSAIAVLTVPENRGKLLLFAGIDKVRFKRIVSPGDELTMVAELGEARGNVGWAKIEARVGNELALRGSAMCATE